MKARTILGMITVTIAAVSSGIAQELRITTTAANTVSSKITIDLPDLTGNPLAIIIATPTENAAAVDAHPIGAWYYNGKWGIFNTDHAAMPLGVQFRVQYFPHAGPGQFLHIFTKENISNGRSYIDSAALNDNPTAVVNIFQNYAPDNRAGYYLNRVAATAAYDPVAGRWYVTNINAERVVPNTAYNILISSPRAIRANEPITAAPPFRTAAAVTKPVPTPTPIAPKVTGQLSSTAEQTQKPTELTFDDLNYFVVRGLPSARALPSGTIDQMAAAAAKEISRTDDRSLPMLLPALQAAGFTVIDRKGKVLLRPMDGKGQGLGFYDFEAVGALRLAQKGVAISLEKLAAGITKETPEVSATQFADLMLKELRANANDSDNTYMRFYARLIVELGKSSPEPVDLMTAPVSQIKLSVLQASLMIRRLQGTLYALRNRIGSTGIGESPLLRYSQFTSGLWRRTEGLSYRPISMRVSNGSPCNLTSDQALILDAAAIHLTTWNGSIVSAFNSPAMTKLGAGVQAANAALAWHKLVASVTMMKGEIHVQDDPLIRTINSDTSKLSNRRLMVARIWSEVGDVEALNCLRPTLNLLTGLDFNLPTGGPLGDVSIEWHFAGDNETRVNDAATRNTNSFVAFESDKGKDPNPQKQVTDDLGLSKMWLVGKAKVPAIMYEKKPAKVEKKADVYVAVTLKSAKDFKQNALDFSGFVLGVAQAIKGGDTIGFTGVLISAGAEIGFRTPYVAARATIPVIDHEPCDGQWIGTVTYTQIRTYKHTIIFPPKVPPNSGGTGYFGGSTTTDQTVTLSGTIHVNSKDGRNSLITSNADEVLTMNTSHTGAGYCDKKMGVRSTDSSGTEVKSASGSSQGFTTVSIFFGKDYYTIGVNPMTVKAVLNSSTTNTHTGCNPGGESYSGTSTAEYVASGITGKAVIGDDPGVLSGSTTTTSNANPDGKTVTTITWNLRRCN